MRERISGLEERFANLASDPSAGIGYCNADATRHVLIAAALLFHLVRSEHLAGRGGDDRIHAKGAARPRRGAYQLVRSAGGGPRGRAACMQRGGHGVVLPFDNWTRDAGADRPGPTEALPLAAAVSNECWGRPSSLGGDVASRRGRGCPL